MRVLGGGGRQEREGQEDTKNDTKTGAAYTLPCWTASSIAVLKVKGGGQITKLKPPGLSGQSK